MFEGIIIINRDLVIIWKDWQKKYEEKYGQSVWTINAPVYLQYTRITYYCPARIYIFQDIILLGLGHQ